MKVEIVIPPSKGLETGNRHTAGQWMLIMAGWGHEVSISEGGSGFSGDLLVVLHGLKCRDALVDYRARVPTGKIVLCLSGTDIYGEGGEEFLASMREADLLVVLQRKAVERVPEEFRGKVRVVVQGAERMFEEQEKSLDPFQICVIGNLREVKDPLRTARAVRALPAESCIEVVHVGAILEEQYRGLVQREMTENSRYRWLGMFSEAETRRLIAESQVMVLSSHSEGGARVLGEAVVEGTPVLASRIDGVVGLLGEDYPGYFEVEDTAGLAALLLRVESEVEFREELKAAVSALEDQFDPRREREAWKELLREVELLKPEG